MTNPIERAREQALQKARGDRPVDARRTLSDAWAIDCFLSALAEEGLCIVPREPTEEMRLALGKRNYNQADLYWQLMLAALNSKEKE